MSYAVAFETGRLVALQSQSFGTLMRRWQNDAHRLVDRLVARVKFSNLSATLDSDTGLDELNALIEENLVSEQFVAAMAAGLLAQMENTLHGGSASMPATSSAAPSPDFEGTTPTNTFDSLSDVMALPGIQALLKDMQTQELAQIVDWLARLALLNGVPFNTLVADHSMLPRESIRFFYLDPNWITALLNGALSIGIQSSRDGTYQKLMQGVIADAVQSVLRSVRQALLGQVPDPSAGPVGTMGGMLLRSQMVSGWPSLEVRGYQGQGDKLSHKPLALLRLTRLSPTVMLALFDGVPDRVTLAEPREGIHFGVESGNAVMLRALSGDDIGTETGASVTAQKSSNGILDIPDLLTQLESALSVSSLTPAQFALEILSTPERVVFDAAPSSGGQ